MDLETPQSQRPPTRRPSARHRRAMSAIARPSTAAMRPGTASGRSRRPYSAYTKRAGEAENTPKYDAPESNREWWRYCVKVRSPSRQHACMEWTCNHGATYYMTLYNNLSILCMCIYVCMYVCYVCMYVCMYGHA